MDKLLLQYLHEEQNRNGYISEKAIKDINTKTGIPLSKIYGVLTFYSMFHTKEQGKYLIEICNSPTCYLNGSIPLIKFMEKELGIKSGDTSKDGLFSLHITSCLGLCNQSPAMLLNKKPYTKLTTKKLKKIIEKCKSSKKQT
jgi:NADH-quinone oxidoreductase subunit E